MPVANKVFTIEAIQSTEISTDPEFVFFVEIQAGNDIIGNAVVIRGIVQVFLICIGGAIEIEKPSTIGADPEISFLSSAKQLTSLKGRLFPFAASC